jgi:hypothetical protein
MIEAGVAIRIGLWSKGLANRRQHPYLVMLSLGELTRREVRGLQSSVSDQQIDHKRDQQNTADAATISPPGIAETAPKEEEQYENNRIRSIRTSVEGSSIA